MMLSVQVVKREMTAVLHSGTFHLGINNLLSSDGHPQLLSKERETQPHMKKIRNGG